ncbi:MAG: hypothetical protein WC877_00455 [Dehalococcoidales bacterium]|jgi:hypothetical protein
MSWKIVIENALWVFPYKKHIVQEGIKYEFYRPSDLLHEDIHKIFTTLPPKLESDILYVRYSTNDGVAERIIIGNEKHKMQLRTMFNIPNVTVDYGIDTNEMLGLPSDIDLYPSETIINNPVGRPRKYPESEPKSQKYPRKGKITRYCAFCGEIFTTSQSEMSKGSGLYCKRECSNSARTSYSENDKVHCTCLKCGFTYQSLTPEEYCCIECENESNL